MTDLEDTFMCRYFSEGDKSIEDYKLHIIVTLLHDQFNVTTSRRLKTKNDWSKLNKHLTIY